MHSVNGCFSNITELWQKHIAHEHYEKQSKEIIRFVKKNAHGYVLYEDLITKIKTIDVVISQKSSGNTWSYKLYNESTHPFYLLCLSTMLSQSTNMHPRAVEWRENCFKQHQDTLFRRKILQYIGDVLTKGMIIKSEKYGVIEFIEFTEQKKSFIGLNKSMNREFTYRFGLFPLHELERVLST